VYHRKEAVSVEEAAVGRRVAEKKVSQILNFIMKTLDSRSVPKVVASPPKELVARSN